MAAFLADLATIVTQIISWVATVCTTNCKKTSSKQQNRL